MVLLEIYSHMIVKTVLWLAQAVYITADEFIFRNNEVLSMRKEGSGIKTRSRKTIIENSILASLDSKDSRLNDAASYGELVIKNFILQQGNNSSNSQLIAYGLEKLKNRFDLNRIEINDNLFLLDGEKANVIISYKQAEEVIIKNNTIVGEFISK